MDRNNRIQELLDELAELGKVHYKDEYKDTIPYFQRIGAAITSVSDDLTGVLQLAYEVLEDWNAHSMCAVLAWAWPKLDDSGINKKYSNDIERLQKLINRDNVEILMVDQWDNEKQEYPIRHARVTVSVEWLD
jgi:hypothetical protein